MHVCIRVQCTNHSSCATLSRFVYCKTWFLSPTPPPPRRLVLPPCCVWLWGSVCVCGGDAALWVRVECLSRCSQLPPSVPGGSTSLPAPVGFTRSHWTTELGGYSLPLMWKVATHGRRAPRHHGLRQCCAAYPGILAEVLLDQPCICIAMEVALGSFTEPHSKDQPGWLFRACLQNFDVSFWSGTVPLNQSAVPFPWCMHYLRLRKVFACLFRWALLFAPFGAK